MVRDAAEGAHVGLKLVFGQDEQDDDVGGLAIEAFEGESAARDAQGADDVVDGVGGAVRERDAVFHAGAEGFFAFDDDLDDVVAQSDGDLMAFDEEVDQFVDGFVFVLGFERGFHDFGVKDLA